MALQSKKVIYYFTGTGNSLHAAQRIAERLGGTELVSMRCDPAAVSARDADTVGFVFPVYHWTLNEDAQRFIAALTVNPNAYVFAVSTLAMINGHAFEALNGLLQKKGVRLQYARRLFSVGNLCIAYPPFPRPRRRVAAAERAIGRIAEAVSRRETNRYPRASLPIRLLYPRVMPKYREVIRFTDAGFVISDLCVGCGLCSRVCPTRNITMEHGKPVFHHQCASCMACVCYCPRKAIGFSLPREGLSGLHMPMLRLLRLPDGRLRYHHPAVGAEALMKDRTLIR